MGTSTQKTHIFFFTLNLSTHTRTRTHTTQSRTLRTHTGQRCPSLLTERGMRVLNFVIIAWHFVFGTHHILFLHTLVDLSCRLTCFSQQRKELGRQVTSKLTLEFLPSPSRRALLYKFFASVCGWFLLSDSDAGPPWFVEGLAGSLR